MSYFFLLFPTNCNTLYFFINQVVIKVIVHFAGHSLSIMSGKAYITAAKGSASLGHFVQRDIHSYFTILRQDLRENVVVLNVGVVIHNHG